MRSFVSDRGSNVESNSRFDDFAHSGHNAIEQAFRQLISESYKFVRMSDDLHDVASHLSDIRICFMALTITVYLLLAVFLIRICIRRSQRQVGGTSRGSATGGTVGGNGSGAVISNAQRRHYPHNNRTSHWDYQTADEYQNAITTTTAQTDDLVSVRSDGQIGISTGAAKLTTPSGHMMGRNHRSTVTASGGTGAATIGIPLAQPAFMRHSGLHMNHQNAVATNAESSNEPTIPSCSNSGAHTSTNTVTRLGADVSSNQRFNTTNGNHLHHHHQIPHIVTSSSECQNTTSEVANSSDALNAQSFSTLRHHHHTSGPGPGAGQTSGNGSNACVNISGI